MAVATRRAKGHVKGQHVIWVPGHSRRKAAVDYIIDPDTGCWEWQLAKTTAGYGEVRRNGKPYYAHRLFYEQQVGPIPEGADLDHLCRNRGCVNPEHLEAVTHRENMRRGLRTKLTPDQVREMRALAGTMTQSALAERYGLSKGGANAILSGRVWKDV